MDAPLIVNELHHLLSDAVQLLDVSGLSRLSQWLSIECQVQEHPVLVLC